jgi:hypothetical protein
VVVTAPAPPQPNDGVIEEARRRQHRRRLYGLLAVMTTAIVVALVFLFSSGSSNATGRRDQPGGGRAIQTSDVQKSSFNVRLYPATIVGMASYCLAVEENGRTGGSDCGGVPTVPGPFAGEYGFGAGTRSISIVVTVPEVASILVNRVRRVSPVAVPGLPYGLRAARIETSETESLPPAMKEAVRRGGAVLVAYDAQGHRLPEAPSVNDRQARVLVWGHRRATLRFDRGMPPLPHPPSSPCRLSVNGLPGLNAIGGQVAQDIRPFPGKLIGEAFLPCVETEYQLGNEPLRALVMLNAADPSGRAGEMPGFHPLPGAPGFFTEGGTLTAKRSGNAWLVVGQGSSLRQRIEVLRRLTATVHP